MGDSAEELLKTPLCGEHQALDARMVPFAGWLMPVQYSGVKDEHQAVRSAAGLFDVSHMGEIELSGPDAAALIDAIITNDAGKLDEGKALYTCACNERGTILDDLIVYRRSATRFLVVCNASNRAKMVTHFQAVAASRGDTCELRDASDDTALVALQGPRAFEVLNALGGDGPALEELGFFRLREATLAGTRCTVARTGYTGEDGVELFCPAAEASALWRALIGAGEPLGLRACGLAARDTLRLEARLSLYGNDIDETTNPFEAGLGWVVKLKKGDFMGANALREIKAAGLERKLVGFEMVGRGIARHGYPLLDANGQVVGHCTSGSPAPSLGKNIGLGYLPIAMAAVDSPLVVDCRGRKIDAVVVKTPFYKRPSN